MTPAPLVTVLAHAAHPPAELSVGGLLALVGLLALGLAAVAHVQDDRVDRPLPAGPAFAGPAVAAGAGAGAGAGGRVPHAAWLPSAVRALPGGAGSADRSRVDAWSPGRCSRRAAVPSTRPEAAGLAAGLAAWAVPGLAAAVALAGLLHVAAAVSHSTAEPPHVVAFAGLAAGQLWLGVAAGRAHRRGGLLPGHVLRACSAGSLWVALLWALTRTTGVALVAGRTDVGATDLLATVLELVAAALCVHLLRSPAPDRNPVHASRP